MKKEELEQRLEAFRQELLKEFSEENKFEVGKWYKSDDTDYLIYVIEHDGINITNGYGFSDNGTWMGFVTIKDRCGFAVTHLATDKEVEEALEKESIKKGYNNPGVRINSLIYYGKSWFEKGGKQGLYNDGYWFMSNVVMKDGKWAEIVEDKIMIGGYEVESEGAFYKIGCKTTDYETLKRIEVFMKNNNFKTVAFDGIETDLETIEKILKL